MQADRVVDAWTKAEMDMRIGPRTVPLGLLAALASALCCAAPAAAEPHLARVNPSEVAVRSDCPTPPPGYARCAAEQLVYKASGDAVGTTTSPSPPASGELQSASAQPASTPLGYGPSELQSAYYLSALSSAQGAGKTIALVDAYDDPNAESDLATYRAQYGLPSCTTAGGCFTKREAARDQTRPASRRLGGRDLARPRHGLGDLSQMQAAARGGGQRRAS